MKFVERMVHYTQLSNAEILEKEKKWEALEAKVGGFPKKRMYRALIGKDKSGTYIFEREWDSLAAYEAAYTKLLQLPESDALFNEPPDFGPNHRELYYTIGDWAE